MNPTSCFPDMFPPPLEAAGDNENGGREKKDKTMEEKGEEGQLKRRGKEVSDEDDGTKQIF